jgi:tRNA(Ile)-lysidine synthase TilS/MesJ
MKSAIVLLSGGLDSTTVLAIARSRGLRTFALSVHYGQRHVAELAAARRVAAALGRRGCARKAHNDREFDATYGGLTCVRDEHKKGQNCSVITELDRRTRPQCEAL